MRLLLCVLLALHVAGAQLARLPYLQNVGTTRAFLLWTTTGDAGSGQVIYGTDPARLSATAASRAVLIPASETGLGYPVWQHQAEFPGLSADTVYYYRVLLDGADVLSPYPTPAEWRFRTASTTAPFTFLVIGDSGDGGDSQRALSERMNNEAASLMLHVGDLAYQVGRMPELDTYYFGVYWKLMRRMPFYPAPGNHDYAGGSAYFTAHSLPSETVPAADRGRYYSFNWGTVHFVSIDTNEPLSKALAGSGGMLEWLERDLANSSSLLRVVYFHHPPFPSGTYSGDSWCSSVERALTPILERNGVHLVLSGHEHYYQRTKPRRGAFLDTGPGTVYVTTGGAGSRVYAPGESSYTLAGAGVVHYLRVNVDNGLMTVRAIGLDGQLLDEFTIDARPTLFAAGSAANPLAHAVPGGLISIFGFDLAQRATGAAAHPWPSRIGGASAWMDDQPMPLLYVSRSQTNAYVPPGITPGDHSIRIDTPAGRGSLPCRLEPSSPEMFQIQTPQAVLPAAIHLDGRLVAPAAPGAPNEWISLFLTGLGDVGNTVRVEIDGAAAAINYAGAAPGLTGVDQINFRIPPATGSGPHSLRIVVGGVAGTALTLYTSGAS